MRTLLLAATICVALGGCVVHVRERHHAPPPPPPPARTTVTISYGWNHHRYVVWREYYGCTDDEVYYLENCGYDDDDLMVGIYLARRARVPLRYVMYEYDRCGRDYYAVAMSFRLPWDIWFCHEVPRGYGCPPVYARAYGYYWRGERQYYSNHEIYALVQLQVGVRYYGYSHTAYFNEYNACVQRGDRTPFRTIVIKDHRNAGRGGKGWDEQRFVARSDRPWNAPSPQDWERRRQAEREQVKIRYTPDRDRREAEEARRAAEARKDAHEQAKRELEVAKVRRMEEDRKHEAEEKARGPAKVNPPAKGPDREPGPPARGPDKEKGPPDVKGPEKRTEPAPPREKGPEKAPERGPEKRTEPAPPREKGPERGPEKKNDAPPPPQKQPERGPEKRNDPPPPPQKQPERGPEKRNDAPPPPQKQPERGPEKKNDAPPPPQKQPERGPEKKSDDGGSKKGPPPAEDKKKK